MATSENAESENRHGSRLENFIGDQVKVNLHIIKSEKRYGIHQTISNHSEFPKFLNKLLSFASVKASSDAESKKANFNYFMLASELRSEFMSGIMNNPECRDGNELFNFYMHTVFAFTNGAFQSDVDSPSRKNTVTTEENCEYEESESALFRLGGGTLGEIWRVSKGKKTNSELYKLVFIFKMSDIEKTDLPVELQNRDTGGMFFPKFEFLPFIRKVDIEVRHLSNPEALKKYGKNMIKICTTEVSKNKEVKDLFFQTTRDCLPNVFDEFSALEINNFFEIWMRKMVHARIAEFVSSNTHSVKKGGQTLRDVLYGNHSNKTTEKIQRKKSEKKSLFKSRKSENNSKVLLGHEPIKEGVENMEKKNSVKECIPNISSKGRQRKRIIFDDYLYN